MLIGFLLGFTFCFICFFVAFIILREIIYKYGKPLTRKLENELRLMEDACIDGTQIIEPDYSKEVFNAEASTIEDLIK